MKKNIPNQTYNASLLSGFPEALVQIDVFTLLGLENLDAEKKAEFFTQMQENILLDFLGTTLPECLTTEDFERVKKMIEEQKDFNAVMLFIQEHIPYFNDLLFAKTLAYKKKSFVDYLDVLGKITRRKLQIHKVEKKGQQVLQRQLELVEKLQQLVASEQWDEVIPLLPEFNQTMKA